MGACRSNDLPAWQVQDRAPVVAWRRRYSGHGRVSIEASGMHGSRNVCVLADERRRPSAPYRLEIERSARIPGMAGSRAKLARTQRASCRRMTRSEGGHHPALMPHEAPRGSPRAPADPATRGAERLLLPEIPAYPRSARKRHDRPVTPEVYAERSRELQLAFGANTVRTPPCRRMTTRDTQRSGETHEIGALSDLGRLAWTRLHHS